MTALLKLEGVTKAFEDGRGRRQILDHLGFELGPGETLALCGPSGSGKTTLLNICGGMIVPDSGSVLLSTPDGPRDLAAASRAGRALLRRRHIGFVFQFFNLVPTLSVRENVLLPVVLNAREDLAERALDRLAMLGLGHALDAFPTELSGGERQRVAIARALAHEPVLVLADEPTGNLDGPNGAQVVDLLWEHVAGLDAALVIATHDSVVARRTGRILEVGQ